MFDDNEYEYDYDRIIDDTDDLMEGFEDEYNPDPDEYDYQYEDENEPNWENYYHNLTEDIDD